MILPIQSPQNEHYKNWLKLLEARQIKKKGHFLLSGQKIINEFLKKRQSLGPENGIPMRVVCEITQTGHSLFSQEGSHFKSQAGDHIQVPTYQLPTALFREVDVLGTHSNLLEVQFEEFPQWTPQGSPSLSTSSGTTDSGGSPVGLEVIMPLGDPNNLGALIRSAVAFGATKIILTKEAAHPLLPKAIRASSGAVFCGRLYQGPSLEELFQILKVEEGVDTPPPLYGLDMNGKSLHQFQWPKDVRLLIGQEGPGLGSYAHKMKTLKIPTEEVESLNAMVAGSIALFSYHQQHSK